MLALPSAPAPSPRRQVFVGTALATAGAAALVGGMVALFLRMRNEALSAVDGRWVPKGATISMVAANVMLLALIPICVFAQWAVYAAKRDDKPHTALALGLTGLIGIAFINAQAFIYATIGIPVNQGNYSVMFFTLTGVSVALALVGVVFSAVTAFRYLGGRTTDREVISAHALYWYAYGAIFTVVWFVVYVTK
jgi:heme/copper-type cytochrome/quinol oxidase subunit 3